MKHIKVSKKKISAFITMVDLIANALAASMCLFFIIASQQMAPQSKQYILGKLILYVRLIPNHPGALKPTIFIIPPGFKEPLFNEDILSLNNMDSFLIDHKKLDYLQPVNVYTDPKDSLSFSIEINDPMKGLWTIGGLYVDSERYPCIANPAQFEFKALFVKENGIDVLTDSSKVIAVTNPTELQMFAVEPPTYTNRDD